MGNAYDDIIDLSEEERRDKAFWKRLGLEAATLEEKRACLDERAKNKYQAEIRYSNDESTIAKSKVFEGPDGYQACHDWIKRAAANGRKYWNGYKYIHNLTTGESERGYI
jgi:hypothetical protein